MNKQMIQEQNEVISHLLHRAKGGKDERIIGLFLPGGGMSGVFSGGVVQVLEKLNLWDKFDYIYGFSSGSCSGAYLLAKNTKMGTSIYWDDLSGKKFIRPWKLGFAMNMEYFVDDIMRKVKILDADKVRKSRTILKIYITNAATAECDCFSNKEDIDLFEVIKASCAYPGFSGKPPEIEGKRYVDGNSFELFPFQEARKDGCTDLLVVPTVPRFYRVKTLGKIVSITSVLFVLNLGKKFVQNYYWQTRNYNNDLDFLFGKTRNDVDISMNIAAIAPSYYVSTMETRASVLRRFERHGIKRARKFFGISKK